MNLIQRISLFYLFAITCSCCSQLPEGHTIQPEWEYEVPTFNSAEIFYKGLPNLPLYNNHIVAHTTIFDGGFGLEDNRLCSIDISRSQVKWYFPNDINKQRYCFFDKEGYVYNNKLVFQYQPDGRTHISSQTHSTVCLNATTGDVIWEVVSRADDNHGTVRDVVGYDDICFFVKDSTVLCRVDMTNDVIEDFYDTDTLRINKVFQSKKYLVLSCNIPSKTEFKDNTYALVLNKDTGEKVFLSYLSTDSVWANCVVYDDVLYGSVYGYVKAINVITGQTIWERNEQGAVYTNGLFVYNSTLLKYAEDGMVAFDITNGDILYKYDSYGSYSATVDGPYVYLLNRKQFVDVVDIMTGKVLETIKCKYSDKGEDFFCSYPVIYDNKLYIMSYNHLFRYPTYPWP